MNKFYFLLFALLVSRAWAQADHSTLKQTESERYAKMLSFNVNPNTLNYDLTYQRLDLYLDPAVRHVGGVVTSYFKPNQNISSIYFDLSNVLTVTEVLYRGAPLQFQQLPTKELKIDLPQTLIAGVSDSLSIRYRGVPSTVGSAGDAFTTSTQGGTPVLYTLSEPYGAQEWFPTKQSMNDKIEKVDIIVTAPLQYSVASNGLLISETTVTGNYKRTFWRTSYPIPAYLIALGITNYTKINDTMGSPPFPFVNYLYPSTAYNAGAMENITWTKDAMELFEKQFGLYPYRDEKYGHMQFGWGGGMEHATMSSMGSFGKTLIAHELAHQWFGDKVTCGAWNDIWLNEGFANFGEHLVNEKLLLSAAQFQNYLSSQMNFITSSAGGSVYVSDANLNNTNVVFDSRLTYAKGGYVVRMMKWILGEEVFYAALKSYLNEPQLAYSYAVTADLRNSLLQSTGVDFTEFFNDWIYGQGFPTYAIRWNQTSDEMVRFEVSQKQSHASVDFFEMPLPVKITGTNGEVLYARLDNTTNNQKFAVSAPFTVASVQFNYENQIVTRNSTVARDPSILNISEIPQAPLSVYPNPAGNQLFVSGLRQAEPYELYSIDGKKVGSGTASPQVAIELSRLTPGVYLLRVAGERVKFIKK